MDYLDDEEFGQKPVPDRPSPVTIVALLAGAGAAVLLLWMNMGLSSRVESLEQTISNLQKSVSEQNQTKEIADISNQLDSVTQALANHLKSQAMSRNESSRGSSRAQSSTRQSFPAPAPSQALPSTRQASPNLPIRPIPGSNAPAQNYGAYNNGSLPPPISRVDIAPVQQQPGGSVNQSGGWVVNITSVSDQESAFQEVQRLRSMGINAESARAVSNGRTWYRIRIPGFASHDDAARARPGLEARLGIRDTWVGRRD